MVDIYFSSIAGRTVSGCNGMKPLYTFLGTGPVTLPACFKSSSTDDLTNKKLNVPQCKTWVEEVTTLSSDLHLLSIDSRKHLASAWFTLLPNKEFPDPFLNSLN
jgi:hypothetical protein